MKSATLAGTFELTDFQGAGWKPTPLRRSARSPMAESCRSVILAETEGRSAQATGIYLIVMLPAFTTALGSVVAPITSPIVP